MKYEFNEYRLTTYDKDGYSYLNVLQNNKRVMVMMSTDKEAIEHDFNVLKQLITDGK